MADLPQRPIRPIVLVGLPGAGKSTIGARLARRLGVAFHDTDAVIEAEFGLPIAEIFSVHGEAAFRAAEAGLLQTLIEAGTAVIAAGGGAFLDPATQRLALTRATTIWLDAGTATLAARLSGNRTRPLLAGNPPMQLAALKRARDPIYARARLRIDAAGAPDAVAEAAFAALREPAR